MLRWRMMLSIGRRGGGAGLALLAVDRWWIAVQLDWWPSARFHALQFACKRARGLPGRRCDGVRERRLAACKTLANGILSKAKSLAQEDYDATHAYKKCQRRSRNREGLFLETRARDTGGGRARGLYG